MDSSPAHVPADSGLRPLSPEAPLGWKADACLAARFPNAGCDACVQACPAACLTAGTEGVSLDGNCLSCGRCAAACPTGALVAAGFGAPAGTDAGPVLADCWRVPPRVSPEGAWRVPCLGGISTGRLLAECAQSQRTVVFLDRGWCGSCSCGGPDSVTHPVVARARALLGQCGAAPAMLPVVQHSPLPLSVARRAIPHASGEHRTTRRAFFARLAHEVIAAGAARAPAASPAPRSAGPVRIAPAERRMQLAALRRAAAPDTRLPDALFPRIELGAGCEHHRVCAGVCPTGALSTWSEGDASGIRLDAADCIACGACERACPGQALRLIASAGMDGAPLKLSRTAESDCRVCGQRFAAAGAEDTCPHCRKRRSLAQAGFNLMSSVRSGGAAPRGAVPGA